MRHIKLLLFAVNAASRAGLDRAGAGFAGGDLRRARAAAYARLCDAALSAIGEDEDRT